MTNSYQLYIKLRVYKRASLIDEDEYMRKYFAKRYQETLAKIKALESKRK